VHQFRLLLDEICKSKVSSGLLLENEDFATLRTWRFVFTAKVAKGVRKVRYVILSELGEKPGALGGW